MTRHSRNRGTVGDTPPPGTRPRYIGVGEVIPARGRFVVHMLRPVGADPPHPDFTTLDRLPTWVPSVQAHPQLRGYLDIEPGDTLRSVYAVFNATAPTTAQAIVDAIRAHAPRDASFSLSHTDVATVEELRRQTAESLQQTVESLPFIGPAAQVARKVAASDWTALLWIGVGVGGSILLAWAVDRFRPSSRRETVTVESKPSRSEGEDEDEED